LIAKKTKQRVLFLLVWFLAVNFLNINLPTVQAAVDPNPPLYQDPPPGPPFKPNLTNLPTSPAPSKYGIASHPWWLDIFLDEFIGYFKELGVSHVRLPYEWKVLEPKSGVYDWAREDRILNRLHAEGFEIIAEFVTVPPWASFNPTACAQADIVCGIKKDPEVYSRLKNLVQASIKRYPYIRHWEFWNEPERWENMGGRDIGDYAPHLRVFYDAAKQADPTVLVAATSEVGAGYIDWLYRYSDSVWGRTNRPWDAIAYHPYNQDDIYDPTTRRKMSIRKERVDQLYSLMMQFGDFNKPIWLTEIGWGGDPVDQAFYMQDALKFIDSRPFVTIASLHMLHDWEGETFGMMRVEPDILWKRPLQKGDKFIPKEPYYSAFKNYPKRKLPPQPEFNNEVLVFPQTQHTVRDGFRKAWLQGGLSLYGFPKTGQFYERNPIDGKYYLVQYFERVRMEYHPEFAGTANEVLFGLLNQILIERKWLNELGVPVAEPALPAPVPPSLPAGTVYFRETGHTVGGMFYEAWTRNGGLAVVGLPKTGVFTERNPDDGKLYQVQYFERARMELHPAEGTRPATVLFGLLGNDRLRLQGRLNPDNTPDYEIYYNPTLPEFATTT
jgi:Beta-galactosidase/Glycosyl hydrolase catalytic core